jgi:hypothetical protein
MNFEFCTKMQLARLFTIYICVNIVTFLVNIISREIMCFIKLPIQCARDWRLFAPLCYHQRTNVTRGVVRPVGVRGTSSKRTSCAYAQTYEDKSRSVHAQDKCGVFSNLGGIGCSTLVPSLLALIFFALLILVAVTWSSDLTFYRRYLLRKKICWIT